MMELFARLGPWHWFIAGVVLMIAETLLPGTFLLWFGVGALVVGVALLVVPALAWQGQLVLFAVVSAATIVAWRRYRAAHPETTSHPALNRRGAQYVGRRFTLTEPIVDGVGRLHVDDTWWRVAGPDLPTGTHVTVVGAEGTVLTVERAAGHSQLSGH